MKQSRDENITRFIEMCGLIETECLEPSEQRAAFERAIHGTSADVDNYIICNTRLVSAAITNLMAARKRAGYLIDDLFSAGLVSLTRAVHVVVEKVRKYDDEKLQATFDQWGKDGPELRVAPYLYVAIYREIRDVYERDSSEPLTKRRRRAILNMGGTLTQKINAPSFLFKVAEDYTLASVEALQGILSTARTSDERAILELKLTYTETEIADMLGMSQPGVSRMLTKLHRRFCKDNDRAYHR